MDENTPFKHLESNMNDFGPPEKRLTWDTEALLHTVNFLDLTIGIYKDGTITTKTYMKPSNYFLYRTPDSCQPENILRSFVYSSLQRYYHQNTSIANYNYYTDFLFYNMLERGDINYSLRKIFIRKSAKAMKSKIPYVTREPPTYISNNNTPKNNKIYIHLPHHTTSTTQHTENYNHSPIFSEKKSKKYLSSNESLLHIQMH